MTNPTHLASDVLLDEMVLSLVVENHMHLLRARSANIRSEHDIVGRLTVEVLEVRIGGKNLESISTMLHSLSHSIRSCNPFG